MRSIRIVTPLVLTIAMALAACEQQAQEAGEMEEAPADTVATVSDEDQLDALRSSYEEAWNARDMDAIGIMMTPDYQEVGPEGVFGYDEAVAMMKDSTNMPPEGATISIDTQTLEIAESGDVAYGSGTTTVTIPGPDGQEMTETSRWVAGFEKVGDEWKLDRLAVVPASAETEGEGATGTM